MNRLIELRYDRAMECLGGESDWMDIEFLARSDEQIRCINEQMRRLFERARAYRTALATRIISHMARVILGEEISNDEIGSGWCIDAIDQFIDSVFADFILRNRFFEIEKEHKELALRAGLYFSGRLRAYPSRSTVG